MTSAELVGDAIATPSSHLPATHQSAPSTRRRRPKLRRRLLVVGAPLIVAAVLTAGAPGVLKVKAGDTLWSIAKANNTSVETLKKVNGLTSDKIFVGDLLHLPGNNPAPTPNQTHLVKYTVRSGDTVYGIARRHGASPASIAQTNKLNGKGTIAVGKTLSIPLAVSGTSKPTSGGAALSKSYVESVVGSTARQLGVDPALAKAIAMQESGFQQQVVSPAGAIGTMQVLPSTGKYLAELSGRSIDLTDVHDNVFAGVYYIRMLVRQAGIDNGIAAYYQGLGSVQKNGMFKDTKAYVSSVKTLRARF